MGRARRQPGPCDGAALEGRGGARPSVDATRTLRQLRLVGRGGSARPLTIRSAGRPAGQHGARSPRSGPAAARGACALEIRPAQLQPVGEALAVAGPPGAR
jgi:hypothetical protein